MTKDQGARTRDQSVAVEMGNTRLKLGLFAGTPDNSAGLPLPQRTLDATIDQLDEIANWLKPHTVGGLDWYIGSGRSSSAFVTKSGMTFSGNW